jgi:hypothetical protein
MRFSNLFKLSFVGMLIFSPAMAQEADKVHDEALKVLRSQSGNTNQPATAAAPAARPPLGESRTEREARLKAEAQQRLAERERLQAEKRRQFEDYVKQRERLRQEQQTPGSKPAAPGNVHNQALDVLRQSPPASSTTTAAPAPANPTTPPPATVQPATPPVAPSAPPRSSTPAPQPQPSTEEVQQKALEILRQQRNEPAAPPVREPEITPRAVAPAPVTPSATAREDTHQKALEVLRQQTPSPASAPTVAPAAPVTTSRPAPPPSEPKPSPDLQRRLDEIQRELNTPQPRPGRSETDNQAYLKELEERALQNRPQTLPARAATPAPAQPITAARPAQTTTPTLDSQTREVIRRQDEELRQSPVTALPRTAPPAAAAHPSNRLDPAAEARAREVLRQQQQAVTAPAATTVAPSAQPIASAPPRQTTPAPAPALVTSPAGDVVYSRELEERARQALLERAGNQASAAAAATSPLPSSTTPTPAPANVSNAPLQTDAELERVHSRAIETLVQVQPGEGAQTQFKSKQDRLRALTDLYRADKMTPAEYHQRRAQILAEPSK